jgi:hypothetical protein
VGASPAAVTGTALQRGLYVPLPDEPPPEVPPLAVPVAPPLAVPVAPPLAVPVAPPLAVPVAPPLAVPVAPPLAVPVAPPLTVAPPLPLMVLGALLPHPTSASCAATIIAPRYGLTLFVVIGTSLACAL